MIFPWMFRASSAAAAFDQNKLWPPRFHAPKVVEVYGLGFRVIIYEILVGLGVSETPLTIIYP